MKTLKALFGLFVVVAVFYTLYLVVPPYFANYQFEDAINTEARLSAYSQKSADDIKATVIKKAHELEIPIQPEQVQVTRAGNEITISADYSVHVDLPGYPVDLNFHPATKNKRI